MGVPKVRLASGQGQSMRGRRRARGPSARSTSGFPAHIGRRLHQPRLTIAFRQRQGQEKRLGLAADFQIDGHMMGSGQLGAIRGRGPDRYRELGTGAVRHGRNVDRATAQMGTAVFLRVDGGMMGRQGPAIVVQGFANGDQLVQISAFVVDLVVPLNHADLRRKLDERMRRLHGSPRLLLVLHNRSTPTREAIDSSRCGSMVVGHGAWTPEGLGRRRGRRRWRRSNVRMVLGQVCRLCERHVVGRGRI